MILINYSLLNSKLLSLNAYLLTYINLGFSKNQNILTVFRFLIKSLLNSIGRVSVL